MTRQTTLVVGATGLLGLESVRTLVETRRTVRALVRPSAAPEKRAQLKRWGVQCVEGDLKDADSVRRACKGADSIVSTASAVMSHQTGDSIRSVDHEGQLGLIDAAEREGVQHFVYVSFPPTPLQYALQRAKRGVERKLSASSLTFTILQPVDFMEVWLGPALGFDPAHGTARVLGDGHAPINWISIRDVARFAAAACEAGAWAGKTLPLGGPDALSPMQVLQMFSELGGPPVQMEHVPEAALEQQLAAAKGEVEETFAASMLSTARGQLVDPRAALALLPGQLRSVRDHALQCLREK